MSSFTLGSLTLPLLIPGGWIVKGVPRFLGWLLLSRFCQVVIKRSFWRIIPPGRLSWLRLPGRSGCFLWRTSHLLRRWLSGWISEWLLCLHVALVADYDEDHFWVAIDFGFFEPAADVVEGFAVGDVVDEDGSCCWAIVASGDGLEGLLSCLGVMLVTVSQICNLMVLSPTVIILAPNSTPMVT